MSVILVVALSVSAARLSSWDVGSLLCIVMLLFLRVRSRRYALVPGVSVGVLIAWAIMPMTVDVPQVLSITALGAAFGGSVNAIIRGYHFAGILGLVGAAAGGVLVPYLIG
jgi:hypothetical protein